MWIGNVLLVLLNLPLIGMWVRLLRIPYGVLFPMIILFAAIGTYSLGFNAYDVYAIAFFGILGYILSSAAASRRHCCRASSSGPCWKRTCGGRSSSPAATRRCS
jgi:TctA family transporter